MEVKHTPGPWKIEPEIYKFYFQITSGSDRKVASCHAGSSKHTDKQSDELCANAQLISAAPDLLEALQLCSAELFAKRGDKVGSMKHVNRAREAIRKATGENLGA